MIKTFTASVASSLMTSFNWMAAANADYKQAQKLQHLSDDHLADMGLTRQDAVAIMDNSGAAKAKPNRARALQLRRA